MGDVIYTHTHPYKQIWPEPTSQKVETFKLTLATLYKKQNTNKLQIQRSSAGLFSDPKCLL